MERNEIEDREPCSDDLCVGIIGNDGQCGVCGRRRDSPAANPLSLSPAGQEEAANSLDSAEAEWPVPADAGDEERTPCRDDLCTGIIGSDGRCGVCGKTLEEIKKSVLPT